MGSRAGKSRDWNSWSSPGRGGQAGTPPALRAYLARRQAASASDFVPDAPLELHARRLRARAVVAVILGVVLSPIIYELTILSVARWKSINGPAVTVQTPVLDTITGSVSDARRISTRTVRAKLHNVPWNPTMVMAMGGVCLALGWIWLRRN